MISSSVEKLDKLVVVLSLQSGPCNLSQISDRSHYPTLSLVSKSFRNLTASSKLYKRRSQLGITQHRVYAVLRNRSTGDFSFYITQQCVSVGILPSLGGINSLLGVECSFSIPLINKIPTLIMGMDVSHGSPGRADVPSVAAVLLYSYFASVRSQSQKLEMIDSLFQPVDDPVNGDNRYHETSNARKPKQIIIFRDGVSESQFNQVLNIVVDQIIKAYQRLGETDVPKFTVIVAQKRHHTKLFQAKGHENVPAGIIVSFDFFNLKSFTPHCICLCFTLPISQGTSRPAHYHVLLDEIGFSPDELQNLIHSLSYVNQRSTTATSIVRYAHLAAAQFAQFTKFEDVSEEKVPQLPRLQERVESNMFFC
ncbi:hypothetical protein IGI04_007679 [Brassica rapa subsp. trilocularis]|uniref:Piwi domain-containing protein n=1 Tax=Brassica rapa subsp. trilocularis TaxID=1813537 RepID=A0ABQ7NKL2_BRACM|nr:hypothetical protein IGI04_007679 [Brassica rapa subsp. trilocularis]